MSRLKSKLVLKTNKGHSKVGGPIVDTYIIEKSVNTLEYGIPGDELTREEVDKILRSAGQRGQHNQLTVEFVK